MRESEFLDKFPAVTMPPTAGTAKHSCHFSIWITVLSLYSNYYSPTCRPPGEPLTWLRRGRCFPPPLHLGDRQAGLGTEALGSQWSHTRTLPGLLMLCEVPKREMGQTDRMSCFNELETTGLTCDWKCWAMGYTINLQWSGVYITIMISCISTSWIFSTAAGILNGERFKYRQYCI